MQCPKCNYDPTMAEMQSSPDQCPSCGVNYEGYARHQASIAAQAETRRKQLADAPAHHIQQALQGNKGATPVIIIDFEMGFWSMVRFMVKLAFAAIPAAIMIAVIWVAILAFLGGLGAVLR